MKKLAIISILAGGILMAPYADVSAQTKNKSDVYKTVVVTSNHGKIKGILDDVTDSLIYMFANHQRIRIPASSIRTIKIRRTGSVGRGALIGGATGLGIGLIVGLADGDDECQGGTFCITPMSAEEKAIVAGIALGSIGALIGCIIGQVNTTETLVIREDQLVFHTRVPILKIYALSSKATTTRVENKK